MAPGARADGARPGAGGDQCRGVPQDAPGLGRANRVIMPTLALCTAVKPFTDRETARLQENALRTWRALGYQVEVLIIGDEAGAAEAARRIGIRLVPEVERTAAGTPLIGSIFERARAASASPILAYANADVLLLEDFLPAVGAAAARFPRFLLVSRRWDLRFDESLVTDGDWRARLRERLAREGRRHPPSGSDVFVFPRESFIEVPALAVGRAGWDNWMIFEARRRRWPVVDASQAMTVIHQDHDYRHLQGGQPHYRHPETDENIRHAGGRRTVLTLADADWTMDGGAPRPQRWSVRRLLREIELLPALRTRSSVLANVFFTVFRPVQAARVVLGWIDWKRRQPGRRADS